MTIEQDISFAFGHRDRPQKVANVTMNSTLRDDALHFEGMDWTRVTADDWRDYSDAYFGLSPPAFLYFLPSIMIASLRANGLPVIAANSLVLSLDTSGEPSLWDEFFNERFLNLTRTEIAVIKQWVAIHLADADKEIGSEFARVQKTLDLLLSRTS